MQLIQRQLTMIPSGKQQRAIELWQKFSDQLMSLIGEKGFLVLYARSLHILRPTFPMLPSFDAEISANTWLADLKTALTEQDLAQPNAANHQLLITFTDILASLIGEDLTTEILHSSWDDADIKRKPATREIDDDE